MEEVVFATATGLAERIRRREVSAVEVLDAYLARIERHNPRLNAVVTLDAERARDRARMADAALARGEVWGPLHGVPITVKDGLATAGLRTTSGNPAWADFVPDTDAPAVARLKAAGAVVHGKTNLAFWSWDLHQSDNPVFGRTRNPWDPDCGAGGSSGGGAAAVAAGFAPLELATDGAGSARVPPQHCGVCGLKPSEYRVPWAGNHPSPAPVPADAVRQQPFTVGAIARSVEDLALALSLIAGPDRAHLEVPPVPLEPLPDLSVRRMRLAWTDQLGDAGVNADARRALARLAADLGAAGATVARAAPDGFDLAEACEAYGGLVWTRVAAGLAPDREDELLALLWGPPDEEDPLTRGAVRARRATLDSYRQVLLRRDALILALERFFDDWDAWLCPVSVAPAVPPCPKGMRIAVDGRPVPYWLAGGAYTAPLNLTGHPAVVLPLARAAAGPPVGVQLVGKRWDEMRLLGIARRVAEVIGPFPHPPDPAD
jgi:amidase